MAKNRRKPSCFYGSTLIFLFHIFYGCGLPTREDYTPSPELIGGDGSGVKVRILNGSAGFVLYYKLIATETALDDDFAGAGQGEQIFKNRGYFKSALTNVGSNDGSLWVPTGITVFPIEISLGYASDASSFIKATIRDANGLEDVLQIYRAEGKSFSSIKSGEIDAGVFNGGQVSISLAMMNFNFNVNTFTRNPSVGKFIGRMPNITISS